MKTRSQLKIALGLAVLVVVSGAAGALVGHYLARHQFEARNDPSNWNEHVTREFDRLVKPTPAQDEKIRVYLQKAVDDLRAIRLDTISRSTNVIWRLVAEVERELTSEQLQEFQAMKPKPSDLTLDVLNVK